MNDVHRRQKRHELGAFNRSVPEINICQRLASLYLINAIRWCTVKKSEGRNFGTNEPINCSHLRYFYSGRCSYYSLFQCAFYEELPKYISRCCIYQVHIKVNIKIIYQQYV